jgi:predicted Abi (CAAX) family protease
MTVVRLSRILVVSTNGESHQEMIAKLIDRWVSAAWVRPNAAGGWAVVQSIVIFGVVALRQDLAFAPTWPPTTSKKTPVDAFLVLARVLVVPSLVEESLFRVLLQPPGTSLPMIVLTNGLFAAYHLIAATMAAEYLMDRPGVVRTFRDPQFLGLAFLLGNLCSYSYYMANYGLWAPVLVHAIPVAVWLSCLGGEAVLLEK